jgi:hypothetical protein
MARTYGTAAALYDMCVRVNTLWRWIAFGLMIHSMLAYRGRSRYIAIVGIVIKGIVWS